MKRFTITSTAPNGRVTTRHADHVVEAWDWVAYFTATAPANVVESVDHEEGA